MYSVVASAPTFFEGPLQMFETTAGPHNWTNFLLNSTPFASFQVTQCMGAILARATVVVEDDVRERRSARS
jgi:hypothetical protein